MLCMHIRVWKSKGYTEKKTPTYIITSSLTRFQIAFKHDSGKCKTLCTRTYDAMNADSKKKLSQLRKGMGMNYQHHWIVDNMPVSYLYFDLNVTCYKKNHRWPGVTQLSRARSIALRDFRWAATLIKTEILKMHASYLGSIRRRIPIISSTMLT